MKKLYGNKGETLVEILAGLLIITLVFVLLTGTISASARISNMAKNTDLSFSYDDAQPVTKGGSESNRIDVVFRWTDTNFNKQETHTETSYLYKADGKYFYTSEEMQ